MEENMFELDTKGMCVLLGVKTLKDIIKRNSLERRLLEKNIRLVKKEKRGRNSYYTIQNLVNENFEELCQKHKIRKTETFKQHTENRYYSINGENELITQQQFANKINEDVRNVKKFDEVLMEEKFMKKDGFKYWVYKDGRMLHETSKEHYNHYWTNNRAEKQLINILKEKLEKKEVSLEEYSNMYSNIIAKLNVKGEVVQRTRCFEKGDKFDKIFSLINNATK